MTQLFTDRLKLRLIEYDDLNSIHELHSLPATDMFNTLGIPENMEATKEIVESLLAAHRKENIEAYTFAIELKISGHFTGLIALNLGKPKYKSAEIWFKLHPDFWAQGFATEAVIGLIKFGFKDLNLHRIEAGCAVDNIGSRKVLEKAGFIQEGRKRQILPLKSGWSDNFEYAILESD